MENPRAGVFRCCSVSVVVFLSFIISSCGWVKVSINDKNAANLVSTSTVDLTSGGFPSNAFSVSTYAPASSFSLLSGSGSLTGSGTYTPTYAKQTTQITADTTLVKVNNIPVWTDGAVSAVVKDNSGNLYLGGSFTKVVTAFPAPNFLSINKTTGDPILTCNFLDGFNNQVSAVVTTSNAIYVGGFFTTYQNTSVGYLVKLDKNCNLDTTFNQVGNGFNGAVYALALDTANNALYVVGSFTQWRGVANNAQRIARLDVSGCPTATAATCGVLDTTFVQPANGFDIQVNTLALDTANNVLYVGGVFTGWRGVVNNAQYLAKLDVSGCPTATAATCGVLDTTFTQAASGFAGGGGAGGAFALVLDADNNALYVGGLFNQYRGVANNAQNIAKIKMDCLSAATCGALDTTFTQAASGFNFGVAALALDTVHNALYVGGNFLTQWRGVANNAQGVARLDVSGCPTATPATCGVLDATFIQPANGFAGAGVLALALDTANNALYVGGSFTQWRGIANNAQRIARLDVSGCPTATAATCGVLDPTFIQPASGFVGGAVTTLVLDTTNNALYVGGAFTQWRGVVNNAQRLAKLDVSGCPTATPASCGVLDPTFIQPASGFNFGVSALALDTVHNALYVVGSFSQWRGVANNALTIAKLDVSGCPTATAATCGVLDTTFIQPASGFAGGAVTTLALDTTNNALYVGGNFTQWRGVAGSAQRIAKLDVSGCPTATPASCGVLDPTFTQAANGFNTQVNVLALDTANNALYVGGGFARYRGMYASFFSILNPTTGDMK